MSNAAKIREIAKQLNPIDDAMFIKMAEDREFCEEILRVILEDPELVVLENTPQWVGKNLQGRSVTLDVKCTLGDQRQLNVEVQKSNNDDHQRRVRYNGAILTTNIADPNIDFKQVPDVCVIYIAQFDVFEKEKNRKDQHALYHIQRVVKETGQVVDNGFKEIYVNARVRDGSPVGELMAVFTEDEAYSEKFPKTSEIKGRYKKDEERDNIMCAALNEYVQELRREDAARIQQYEKERRQYAAERQRYAERETQFAAERQQYAAELSEKDAEIARLRALLG